MHRRIRRRRLKKGDDVSAADPLLAFCGLYQRVDRVCSCSLEPTSRACAWDSSARRRASLSARAPVLDQVRAATGVGGVPRPPVPRAPVLMRPLQHLQVASLRRLCARPLVPRAPVFMRPLEDLQVASRSRAPARLQVPRATVLTRPLKYLQVPSKCRAQARRLVPVAPVRV